MKRHCSDKSNLLMTSTPASSYKDVSYAAAADDDDSDNDVDDDDDDDDDDYNNDNNEIHQSRGSLHHKVVADEAPEDLDAFFVHPLTAASRATDDGDALALLHEYRNLPLLDIHLSATSKLKSSLSSSSSSSSSGADMINSDRVTSSSDEIISHVMTLSPPSDQSATAAAAGARRRQGNQVTPPPHHSDYDGDDDVRNSSSQAQSSVLSASVTTGFTQLPTHPQVKRVKTKQSLRSDFDDVVSSQYESYEDDDDNDEERVMSRPMNNRLQRQNDAADDYDYYDDGNNNVIAATSQSNKQPPPSSSSSAAAAAWVSAVTSQTRRKRKPSSTRRFDRSLSVQSYSSPYMEKNKANSGTVLQCMDTVSGGGGGDIDNSGLGGSAYQLTSQHSNPPAGYYEQLRFTQPRSQTLDYRTINEERTQHPTAMPNNYQLEFDLRPAARSALPPDPAMLPHHQHHEFQDDMNSVQSRLGLREHDDDNDDDVDDDNDESDYQLDYDPVGPAATRHEHQEAFTMSQYYGQQHHHSRLTHSEKTAMTLDHDTARGLTYDSKQPRQEMGLYSRQDRHPMNDSELTQFYRGDATDLRQTGGLQDDYLPYDYAAKTTDQPYFSSRHSEISSATMIPALAPMIKTSPQDEPNFGEQLAQHNASSASILSLPLAPFYTVPRTGAAATAVGTVKDVAAWPAATDDERAQSATALTSSSPPLFGPLSNVVKVEDSSFHPNDTAPSLPSSSSSSSLTFDYLKRDLLAQRGDLLAQQQLRNLETDLKQQQRRRRRHNTSTITTSPAISVNRNNPNPNPQQRFSPTTAAPSSSTSASPAANVAGYLPARLPFSLPPVPPGYRLVITHRPMADTTDDASKVTQLIIDHPSDSTPSIHSNTTSSSSSSSPAAAAAAAAVGLQTTRASTDAIAPPARQGGDMMKQRAAERPQSLNIMRNAGNILTASTQSDTFLPAYSAGSTSGSGSSLPSQQVSSEVKSVEFDILEQSLRAADVLADYSNSAGLSLQARSLSLPCTPVSSSAVAPSVSHPLVDGALDFSQQQRLNSRRLQRNNYNSSNYNNNSAVMGRHSLSDIVTPTSDVTTTSSPSECFSQDECWPGADASADVDRSRDRCGASRDSASMSMTSSLRHIRSPSYEAITSFTRRSHISVIPKIEDSQNEYSFYLEAAISTSKQIDEDRLTYLNKGQYYGLVMMHNPSSPTTESGTGSEFQRKSTVVRSVVMVLFRERHSSDEEQTAWELWHMRQHSFKQRVIDVDAKVSGGAAPLRIDEIAYNAVAVVWNTRDKRVKVNIAVNCLSTDFSHQKGIKGSPLHLQIDTFEDGRSSSAVHRAYSQIKVFCDKGADRKSREEERKLLKRTFQGEHVDRFQKPCDRTYFYSMADLTTRPLLFHPQSQKSPLVMDHDRHPLMRSASSSSSASQAAAASAAALSNSVNSYDVGSAARLGRGVSSDNPTVVPSTQRVLLYVRKQRDHVFTALILDSPTVHSLLLAIQEKYNVGYQSVKNVYRRSKKALLAHLDDNFIRHFANESTFIIDITPTPRAHNSTSSSAVTAGNTSSTAAAADDDDVSYDVTLSEIDVYGSNTTAPSKH